jgi:hypothetical protein
VDDAIAQLERVLTTNPRFQPAARNLEILRNQRERQQPVVPAGR